jgi:hypothetical protein
VHLFGITTILLIGSFWIGGCIHLAFQSRMYSGFKKWIKIVGFSFMAIGAFGFFGIAFSACGGLPFSFQWPVGSAKGILVMPEDQYVVPLRAANRIQIYDSEWKFLRGWYVDAHAGTFEIRIINTNKIEVLTARGDLRYVYNLDGSLLSKGTYSPEYSEAPSAEQSVIVPTHWWLWPFTGPFYSWALVIFGMAIQFLAEPKTKFEKTYPPGI